MTRPTGGRAPASLAASTTRRTTPTGRCHGETRHPWGTGITILSRGRNTGKSPLRRHSTPDRGPSGPVEGPAPGAASLPPHMALVPALDAVPLPEILATAGRRMAPAYLRRRLDQGRCPVHRRRHDHLHLCRGCRVGGRGPLHGAIPTHPADGTARRHRPVARHRRAAPWRQGRVQARGDRPGSHRPHPRPAQPAHRLRPVRVELGGPCPRLCRARLGVARRRRRQGHPRGAPHRGLRLRRRPARPRLPARRASRRRALPGGGAPRRQ